MIIVNIYNGMEVELDSSEGTVSENFKIFKHYYYSKVCNLIHCKNWNIDYVTKFVEPDFKCVNVETDNFGFVKLVFDRVYQQQVHEQEVKRGRGRPRKDSTRQAEQIEESQVEPKEEV